MRKPYQALLYFGCEIFFSVVLSATDEEYPNTIKLTLKIDTF